MARVLNTQGQLEAQLGRHGAASIAYREALAWAQRAPRDPALELAIRLNLAELQLDAERFLEVDERSEEHTSELQSRLHLVCRLLLEKKKKQRRLPPPRPAARPAHSGE